MSQTVNIFAQDIRNKVRKEIPFIPDAYVEFYDDITAGAIEKAGEKNADINTSLDIILNQIASWNLADDEGELPITMETLKRLPIKIIRWMSEEQSNIIDTLKEDKKKESIDS